MILKAGQMKSLKKVLKKVTKAMFNTGKNTSKKGWFLKVVFIEKEWKIEETSKRLKA